MNSDDMKTWRQKRLADFAAAMGGEKMAGQKLGYKDGAYIWQMIKGRRPITEKTVDKVHQIRGFAHWFDSALAIAPADAAATGVRAVFRQSSAPSLADHLQGLGEQLAKLDDAGRKLAGTLLVQFALNPVNSIQVAAFLQGAVDAASAQVVSDRRPDSTASL